MDLEDLESEKVPRLFLKTPSLLVELSELSSCEDDLISVNKSKDFDTFHDSNMGLTKIGLTKNPMIYMVQSISWLRKTKGCAHPTHKNPS